MTKHTLRVLSILCLSAAAIWLAGCAFVNVNLPTGKGPLEERVVEGKGDSKILIVDITGVISGKARKAGLMGKRPPLPARIHEELTMAASDPLIAGIILRIDSPGGTVAASDNIYHEVMEFRHKTKKPVYASITGIGASGGYYVACAAEKINVHPAAITGSIGVIAMQLNVEGLMKKLGITDKTYKTGANKAMFSPFRADTPDQQKIIQALLDGFHKRFVDIVFAARAKKLSRSALESLADGRPYTAEQARNNGLVDAVAYLGETIEAMQQELGIDQARVIRYVRPGGHAGGIYSMSNSSVNLVSLDTGALADMEGPEFLYIWPGR